MYRHLNFELLMKLFLVKAKQITLGLDHIFTVPEG